jgi:hypothetical protein
MFPEKGRVCVPHHLRGGQQKYTTWVLLEVEVESLICGSTNLYSDVEDQIILLADSPKQMQTGYTGLRTPANTAGAVQAEARWNKTPSLTHPLT